MERKGDWMQTFTGLQFWPLDPRPEEICIEDIAHSLSLQCRYAGHVKKFYSVGEHSWRVSQVCDPENELWGLLHDAGEAYLVDLPRPIKHFSALGDEYRLIEKRLMIAVCLRFGLPEIEPPDVKKSDDFLLQWEQRDFMAPAPKPWREHGALLPEGILSPMSPRVAEIAFLQRFEELKERWRR